jgi:hypothetical protein
VAVFVCVVVGFCVGVVGFCGVVGFSVGVVGFCVCGLWVGCVCGSGCVWVVVG